MRTPASKRTLPRARAYALAPLVCLVAISLLLAFMRSTSPTRLDPVLSWCSPAAAHPFGCGEGGVDLLALVSRAELGGIALAVLVALTGFALGTPLGASAALARGRVERVVSRAADLIQAFPTFLLALVVLSSVRSPTRLHLGLVFAATAWAPFARLALAETRVLREASFIEAARALGLGRVAVVFRHLLPQLVGVVAVQLGATASAIVVSEAALAFVGLGPRDGVSLGGVMDQGVAAMLRAPHVLTVGALAIFLTSVSLLVAGRGLSGGMEE
jgi:ABC-type dipeptide/oligopeptide/nickel transport system permease subunit